MSARQPTFTSSPVPSSLWKAPHREIDGQRNLAVLSQPIADSRIRCSKMMRESLREEEYKLVFILPPPSVSKVGANSRQAASAAPSQRVSSPISPSHVWLRSRGIRLCDTWIKFSTAANSPEPGGIAGSDGPIVRPSACLSRASAWYLLVWVTCRLVWA